MSEPGNNILIGTWTYRSFVNNPDLSVPFNNLEFGRYSIFLSSDQVCNRPMFR
jgi:hypothetical protein